MAKLYELSTNYRNLNQWIENAFDSEEGIPEDDLQLYKDTLESIKDSIEEKCKNIIWFLKNIESDINGFKAEEDRLNARREYLENKYKGLKKYMEDMLRNANIKDMQAGTFKIKFYKNSQPSVEILDVNKIPTEFITPQEPKIDKKGIAKAVKDGLVIEGAKVISDKDHMRIV